MTSTAIIVRGTFEDRLGYAEHGAVRRVIDAPEYGAFREFSDAMEQLQSYEDLSSIAPFYECEAFCVAITAIEIVSVPDHEPELYWRWMEG